MAAHWADDFCKAIWGCLTTEQRAEILHSRQYDGCELRRIGIDRAIELCEVQGLSKLVAKNEPRH